MRALASDAFSLAAAAGITVYEATYLTLAVRLETQVITGDERFARMLAGHAACTSRSIPARFRKIAAREATTIA
jgi:predicted nucleic acid-binding protein